MMNMPKYTMEFNGKTTTISSASSYYARHTFLKQLEDEGVVKFYKHKEPKLEEPVETNKEPVAEIEDAQEIVEPIRKPRLKQTIEELLSVRDGSCREYIGYKRNYYRENKK